MTAFARPTRPGEQAAALRELGRILDTDHPTSAFIEVSEATAESPGQELAWTMSWPTEGAGVVQATYRTSDLDACVSRDRRSNSGLPHLPGHTLAELLRTLGQ